MTCYTYVYLYSKDLYLVCIVPICMEGECEWRCFCSPNMVNIESV